MTLKPFFRPATLLFVCLWLGLLTGGRARFFQDPGTFWHSVFGERILNHGVFDKDVFTFTFAGKTYVLYQWLGEVGMAVVHRVDGFDSLLLATCTILAALFTWLGVRLMNTGLHPVLAFVIVGFAVAASSGHFHVRPHLATMVGFAVMGSLLIDVEAGRVSRARLWWFVPIFWVWVNLHGGALGGLATLVIAFAGWTFAWLIGWESPVSSLRQAGTLAAIVVLSAATSFVNPFGAGLPEVWLEIYRMPSLPRIIQEHAPLNLRDPNAWMVVTMALAYLGVLASAMPTRPRVTWLLPLVWLALTWTRVRHAPLFAILATLALADIFPRTRLVKSWQARDSDLYMPGAWICGVRAFVIPALLVSTAFGLQAARVQVPVIGHGWAKLDPEKWPLELLPVLREHQHIRPDGTRIFNEYSDGAFLMYFAPGYRIFVDDRCELFGDAWLADYIDAPENDPAGHLRRWEKEYGPFDMAMVYVRADGGGFYGYFVRNDEWELVKKTSTEALFKHK